MSVKPLQVMVVDDELGMRMGAERTLSDFCFDVPEAGLEVSFKVITAQSGEEALRLIKDESPDILLLDYKLPGMNGLELLNQISADAPDMLTIMITAYASIETAIRATRQGAYDFLPKPFTPEELRGVVRKTAIRLVLARQARRLTEEKKRVRFEFIRVLGHELKAPLAAVEGYINIMKDQTLGSDLAAYGEMVDRSHIRLEQMKKLIVDLLDMTRIESGEKQRNMEPVDFSAALRSAVELIQPDADTRGITVALQIPDSMNIPADRGEIDMIFNNLLTNAVKYNVENGRIDAALSKNGTEVVITVSDTGIGMASEDVNRLFGEFVRIKNSRTKNILGSGLGLSILKRLVELYEGCVTVKSTMGEGSTFTVRLKCNEAV